MSLAATAGLMLATVAVASASTTAASASAGPSSRRVPQPTLNIATPHASTTKVKAKEFNLPGYDAMKAAARAKVGSPATPTARNTVITATGPSANLVVRKNFAGLNNDGTSSPADPTGAIGTTVYVQMDNSRYARFSRAGVLLSSGTLASISGASAGDNVFDPQVIFDTQTRRFYYAMDNVASDGHKYLAVGYSTTAAATAWCSYLADFGTDTFPDYPKLGDNQAFTLYGTNLFSYSTGAYQGSALYAINKPAAGTGCSTLNFTGSLSTGNGLTPVPAQQTDTGGAGYAVAEDANIYNTGSASQLYLFKVTNNAGAAVITSSTVAVPTYSFPPDAPSAGGVLLDTLDGRPTQAVSAVDPTIGVLGLWTQQTVAGGAGTMSQWYEINPGTHTVRQSGTITGSPYYVFNGSISPDRGTVGGVKVGGGSAVLQVNTSHATDVPRIWAGSNVNHAGTSALTLMATSPSNYADFTCNTCRWGDYSAMTPDPNPGSGTAVWGTNMLGNGNTSFSNVGWGTQVFAFTP